MQRNTQTTTRIDIEAIAQNARTLRAKHIAQLTNQVVGRIRRNRTHITANNPPISPANGYVIRT